MSKYTQHAIIERKTTLVKVFGLFDSDINFTIACIVIGLVGIIVTTV